MWWDYVLLFWAFLNDVGGVIGWIAGSCALALAITAHFRLNRFDSDARDDASYEMERRVARLEADAGLDGSWEESVRTKH